MPIASPASYAQRLRKTSWTEVLQTAWLTLIGAILIKLMLPAAVAHALRPLVLIAPMLVIVAKDLSHLPDALQRLRSAAAKRDWGRMATACLPPELVGLLRLDGQMRRACLAWLRRRPQPALPAGQALSYLERGSYRTAIAIALFSALFELPLHALILPLFIHDADKLRMIHVLMLAGSLSTLVWVLGDRWLVGKGCHVLTADGLELRVGARTEGTIPLEYIAACERVDGRAADWCRQRGIARHATLLASPLPLDKPNTVLILKSNSPVRLTHMGVERDGLSCVFLYLDRPELLVHALCAR
jgi:hypothetical protein